MVFEDKLALIGQCLVSTCSRGCDCSLAGCFFSLLTSVTVKLLIFAAEENFLVPFLFSHYFIQFHQTERN